MRRAALLCTLLLCCTASYVYAVAPELDNVQILQTKGYGDPPQPATLVGGDTFATATVIPALPYADGGTTCGYANDYGQPCALSAAPDVVYSFAPAANMCVNVVLCGSSYDTMIGIFANNPATQIGCNDDFCGLQSTIENVALTAGNTYYFVVDGYNVACGDYTISITECPPPPVCDPCPAVSVPEGEPVCFTDYVDSYNGGCNSTPNVFSRLLCEPTVSVCGTYGTYMFTGLGYRDTDWYEFTVNAPSNITATVNGAGLTGSAVAILNNVCPPVVLCGNFTPSAQCATVVCNAVVPAGTYRIFVGSFFDATPCGTPYVLTLSGLACPPTSTEASTWGQLKSLYR